MPGGPPPVSDARPLREQVVAYERLVIERALGAAGGSRSAAAAALDVDRSTLFLKMRLYGLLRVEDARHLRRPRGAKRT